MSRNRVLNAFDSSCFLHFICTFWRTMKPRESQACFNIQVNRPLSSALTQESLPESKKWTQAIRWMTWSSWTLNILKKACMNCELSHLRASTNCTNQVCARAPSCRSMSFYFIALVPFSSALARLWTPRDTFRPEAGLGFVTLSPDCLANSISTCWSLCLEIYYAWEIEERSWVRPRKQNGASTGYTLRWPHHWKMSMPKCKTHVKKS